MGRKKLVFMYMGNTDGFISQELNFSTEEVFCVNEDASKNLELILVSEERSVPKNFFGDNISGINLLVGSNGSGKTTVMRTICQWVCELSEGCFPQERGLLVFKEENFLSYVAFENGRAIDINTDGVDIDNFLIKQAGYFSDLRLIYFTNTRTKLGIENYNILLDYSYSHRIKEANSNGHAMGGDVMENYERYEFDKQISVALDMDDFPIHYIFMEFKSISFGDINSLLSKKRNDIVNDLSGLWEIYFGGFNDRELSKGKRLLISFLYTVFYDMIKKLLKLKGEFGNNRQSKVEEKLYYIIQENGSNTSNLSEGIKWIKRFLTDLLCECKKIYGNSSYKEVFEKYWEKNCNNIIWFIDSFLLTEQLTKIINFLGKWERVSTPTREHKNVWRMKLKENKEAFREFWNASRQIFLYIDDVYFFWNASSGEKNWASLIPALRYIPENIQNVWLLLDEPDNTFHPEWERRLIKSIIDIVDNNKECQKQIWISTHSPIMLSDMPGPSVNYLKSDDSKCKRVVTFEENKTFGQNIYYLYNNAFFLEDGVIGEFASEKITELVLEIKNIEKDLLSQQKTNETIKKIEERIDKCGNVAKLVAEPVYAQQIQYFLAHCRELAKR